ncbi:MAG: hypothetical protein M3Q27_04945 [Actinomycetota bacterium]|nr:hypothetical protein [Actinomycetota bacterium]
MLIYDDTFGAVMAASQREATQLGAHEYGSEHVLLGLLTAGGATAEAVTRAHPSLTAEAVRSGIERAVDDLPHLQRLGIDPEQLLRAGAESSPRGPTPRNRHTPESQAA